MIKSDCPSSKGSNQDDALIKGSNDCSLFTSTNDELIFVKNDVDSASRKGSNLNDNLFEISERGVCKRDVQIVKAVGQV